MVETTCSGAAPGLAGVGVARLLRNAAASGRRWAQRRRRNGERANARDALHAGMELKAREQKRRQEKGLRAERPQRTAAISADGSLSLLQKETGRRRGQKKRCAGFRKGGVGFEPSSPSAGGRCSTGWATGAGSADGEAAQP
jgi:hypothetical protein